MVFTSSVSFLQFFLALALAPLLLGIINKTKAFFGGRKGQPLIQAYYELFKLMRKGAVYSSTATWIFRLCPVLGLAAILLALAMIPAGGSPALLHFQGDFILLVYILGLIRFFTVLAALDTGSAFEGMGASREMQFALLSEPVLFICLGSISAITHRMDLSEIYNHLWSRGMFSEVASVVLVSMALLLILLAENSRIPVDDPNTHLELTMIHEVMVLDNSGADLAFIQYTVALKLWIFCSLLCGMAIPLRTGSIISDIVINFIGIFIVAVIIGIIESTMARLRMLRVPQMLTVALAIALSAFFWIMR